MQIKAWNDSRLDAKIETPLNGPGGTTCGGVMGIGAACSLAAGHVCEEVREENE